MIKSFSKLAIAGAIAAGMTLSASAMTIGYVTKSATNAGWIMINQGATDAAKEEGVKLVTVGPAFKATCQPVGSFRELNGPGR